MSPQDLALQQELLQRSSFETQKLEVMNKMSSLTLQQRTLERENIELRNRLRRAELGGRPPVSGPPSPPPPPPLVGGQKDGQDVAEN